MESFATFHEEIDAWIVRGAPEDIANGVRGINSSSFIDVKVLKAQPDSDEITALILTKKSVRGMGF